MTLQVNETTPRRPIRRRASIRLIGLTLVLGYLVVLGGTYLKGDFPDRPARPADRQRFRQCRRRRSSSRAKAKRRPPTTGRCTNKPKSAPSATTSTTITAGTIRRLSVCRRGAGDAALSRRGDRLARGDARRLRRGDDRHSWRDARPPHQRACCARFSRGAVERDRRAKRLSHRALIGGTLGLLERRPALPEFVSGF